MEEQDPSYCFYVCIIDTWFRYLSPGDQFFSPLETLGSNLFLSFSRSNRYTCTNAGLRASSTSFTWLPQKKRDDRINISHTDFSWSPTSTSSPTPERCSSYYPSFPLLSLSSALPLIPSSPRTSFDASASNSRTNHWTPNCPFPPWNLLSKPYPSKQACQQSKQPRGQGSRD